MLLGNRSRTCAFSSSHFLMNIRNRPLEKWWGNTKKIMQVKLHEKKLLHSETEEKILV